MPKIQPIQNDFTAGILTPRLRSRSDTDVYRSGVADSVNFIPLRHGPLETRGGMRFVSAIDGTVGKLFPFQLSPDSDLGEGFPVVITDTELLVYGTTSASAGVQALANPDFKGGGAHWSNVGPVTVAYDGEFANFTADDTDDSGISQQIEVRPNIEHLLKIVPVIPEGFQIFPDIYVAVGTTKGGEEILAKTTETTVTFDPLANTQVWVTIYVEGGDFSDRQLGDEQEGDPVRILKGTPERSVDLISVTAPSEEQQVVTFPHSWASSTIPKLKAQMTPDGNTMYITSGDLVPYKLEYDVGTASWDFDAVLFTDPPAEWVDGSWPTVLTFFQSRSWWGGAAGKPNTLWASETGAYETLTIPTTPTPDSALEFTLSNRGRIQWIEAAKNLLVGTTNGEYIMTATNGPITTSDVQVEQQSANGGSTVQSEPIGNQVLYSSLDGRKLRSTIFRWDEQAWVSRDLTFTAEHLTESARIAEIAFAKDPESIVWVVTSAGTLLGCTFEPYNGTTGWHRHVTDGTIVSSAVLETSTESAFYLLVSRGDSGLSLEVMDNTLSTDMAAVQTSVATMDVNFPHLANKTVKVLVDGAVHPDITLDGNGDGVLQWDGTEIQAGLGFIGTITTLPPDYGSLRGSAMSNKKRWNSITLRLYSSRDPKVNGNVAPERSTETPMDTSEPLRNYDLTFKNVGWGDGSIRITQDLPIKTRISGLFGELNQESL